MTANPAPRRKLIEVDLPLAAINKESAREKSLRNGHPSTLHQYWARRPLAACRAVIFASLVDDPEDCTEEFPTKEAQQAERQRLHALIERLVIWENVQPDSQDGVLDEARREIARSLARDRGEPAPTEPDAVLSYLSEHAPPLHDPFAGSGSIPLEAQRLGLRAIASDLNPLAVLINKALVETPPKFRDQTPINPDADALGMTVGKGRNPRRVAWRGAAGLADDIRYYGRWMRDETYTRMGHQYPKASLPNGSEATVIAWLWARTIPCPNPACGVRMPLLRTFQLSTKKGDRHWIRPLMDRAAKSIRFVVQDHDEGVPKAGTVDNASVVCVACRSAVPLTYVRQRARSGDLGEQMTAIVAEGHRKRIYLSPVDEHIDPAMNARSSWRPTQPMPDTPTLVSGRGYGFTHWHQLFTERQLTTITAFSQILSRWRIEVDQLGVERAYSDAVTTGLALALSRCINLWSSFTSWMNDRGALRETFPRQAIPMVWDYAEANPFSTSGGNFMSSVDRVAAVVQRCPALHEALVMQDDAASSSKTEYSINLTDPPYYDNIDYADLSDFFYVWLRPILRDIHPELFAGILTPKTEEMVAIPARFKDPHQRFENLLGQALRVIRKRGGDQFPTCIFYAYKQQEEERQGRASTGWETMLNAMIQADFQVVGTWPVRTESPGRILARRTNALSSSIVIAARPRSADAPTASRRQFLDELERDLPAALDQLTREGHIAPTDLAQAAIGPGMQVYSRYRRVETISGEPVTIREALAAINQVIDNYEERQEGELDAETRFCLRWLRQHGHKSGSYGDAEVLSQASNVVVGDLAADDLLTASRGVVRLLSLDDYQEDRPWTRGDISAWEGCHRMAWHMNREAGELFVGAARVVQAMGIAAEAAERLARLLYSHYDRAGDSANAHVFNTLVTGWPQILDEARQLAAEPSQVALDL
ncbi:MAG: DUF1156 domain-containing protein [Chloroflexi bacterium]|nr:DUF1156 domain-containing protein [Chloroflexota bacterium]